MEDKGKERIRKEVRGGAGRLPAGRPGAAGTPGTAHQFEVLDGLRGVAALCVFLFHSGNGRWAANGFLAVDFFFMLSGFVVAHSYRDRLSTGTMSLGDFAIRRVIRLYPMVLAGVVLGAAALLAHNIASPATAHSGRELVGWTVHGLLVLPRLDANPFLNAVFPVNVVLWSLFLELLANAVYALGVRQVSRPLLALLVAGGLATVMAVGPTDGGGSVETFPIGFARVAAGFAGGVLLFEFHRAGALPRVAAGLVPTGLLLVVITLWPGTPGVLWLPVIHAVFAGAIVLALGRRAGPRERWWCQVLGTLSYPLYLLHRPLTTLVIGFAKLAVPLTPATYPLFVAASLLASVVLSLAAVRFYETPARQALTGLRRRLGQQRPRTTATADPSRGKLSDTR